MISQAHLLEHLGRTDVYLLDQFMKGRFQPTMRVLDAGCGSGRNLDLFLRGGYEVWIADARPEAITAAQSHAAGLQRPIPDERTRVGALEHVDLPAAHFDAVLSIAVLHFARDRAQWRDMVDQFWRVLSPGGVLFARLASTIGIEEHVTPLGGGRFRLGDGSDRFLVTLEDLLATTRELGAHLLEPVKTVNVQNLRCMTNWVLRR